MSILKRSRIPLNSTTVRIIAKLFITRLGFRLGSWLAPEATVRRAGRLFTRPFASSRTRALVLPADGAEQITLDIDGMLIQAYAWGDPATQPYVLFAHGWSSHGTRFAPWVAPLRAAGFAVVAFDQAAHGRSSGSHTTLPDFTCHLLAVGQRFGPAAAVIGHSLGGAAAALALTRGLQARRAVLIAPVADPLQLVEHFSRMIWMSQRLGRRMFARFEQAMRFDVSELQAQHNAPALGQPALIVHDLEDREIPWSEGERYARLWPGARLLNTTGLGHDRIVDDAGVMDACLRFLRGEAVGERVVSSPNLPYGFA